MGTMDDKTLVLATPDYGDGLVLLPADSIAEIRESEGEEGERLRVEEAMLDELDDDLTNALIHAGLAQVEDRLGSFEVLVISESGRAAVVALCESMGYVVTAE